MAAASKQFLNQILNKTTTVAPFRQQLIALREVHSSVYDKNVDDQVRPTVIPDGAMEQQQQSENYWAPNPRTGVFGPATDQTQGESSGSNGAGSANGESDTVLEQQVWFRPLENVEKPQHQA
ncbi:hypothetical protein ACHQM5_007815 [Ranunculus cassubicifolius]